MCAVESEIGRGESVICADCEASKLRYPCTITNQGGPMKVVALAVLSFLASQASFSNANEIETFFSEAKKSEIQGHDLGPVSSDVSKLLGKTVEFTVDWKSFKGSTFNGSEELGSTIQTMAEVFHNMADQSEDLNRLKAKLKSVNFKNTKNPIPSMKFAGGILTVEGEYGNLQWSKAGRVSDLVRKVLK